MTKQWYKSKTIWINLATLIAAAIAERIADLIQSYIELVILAAANIVLRTVTRERIE